MIEETHKNEKIRLDVFNKQSAIIKLQSEVINELFALLLQHVTANEADKLPVINKINTAALMSEEIREWVGL